MCVHYVLSPQIIIDQFFGMCDLQKCELVEMWNYNWSYQKASTKNGALRFTINLERNVKDLIYWDCQRFADFPIFDHSMVLDEIQLSGTK